MKTKHNSRIRSLFLLMGLLAVVAFSTSATMADCFADEEYEEALKQTEDEWNAVRETMQQSSAKFKEFVEKYQEYEDFFFSAENEAIFQEACELLGVDPKDRRRASSAVRQIRDMFNQIDAAGLKTKIESLTETLDQADEYMGEAQNAYEFAKKFDPANAKENPTYGLRLIGTMLSESADKLNKIPLVGEILGKWVGAYGEVTGDFANALDRLSDKIKNFRQGSLCAQLGLNVEAQRAFDQAASAGAGVYDGEGCETFFRTATLPRMRGHAYAGGSCYYLFDPVGCRGYFAHTGNTDKVYRWHELLLNRVALQPDWLANRANSLKPEVETRAREHYGFFSGWQTRSHNGWVIIEALGDQYQQTVFDYGTLAEETFVANYVLDEAVHNRIENVITEYNKHSFASGTVWAEQDGEKKPVAGASIEVVMDGKTHSATSTSSGTYDLLMKAQPGPVGGSVSATDYEDYPISGSLPDRVVLGWDFTLGTKSTPVTISGIVVKRGSDPAEPVAEATVTASGGPEATEAEATSGAGGSFSLTITAPLHNTITLTAVSDKGSGSASVVASGGAVGGVIIAVGGSEESTTGLWTIAVTVHDADGQPLPGAAVTGGTYAASTNGAGVAVIGPIEVKDHTPENPFSITLTASIAAQDGSPMASSPMTLTYSGEPESATTLVIPVQQAAEVTVTGLVLDANGVGVDGAAITAVPSGSATTGGGGRFALAPVQMFPNTSIEVSASFTDGTNTFGAGPVTATYDGQNKNLSVTLTLGMAQATAVTISGRVIDRSSKPLPGAAVSLTTGESTVSGADGSFALPPVQLELGAAITISASITTYDGQSIGGQVTVKPNATTHTGATIRIDVEQDPLVTISGTVVDTDGKLVSGAAVDASGLASTVTSGAGTFTLPPFPLKAGSSVTVSATAIKKNGATASGQSACTPEADGSGSVTITLDMKAATAVTISGTVTSTAGSPVSGAVVTAGGQSTTTDGGGSFSLAPIEVEEGQSVGVSATAVAADGSVIAGQATAVAQDGAAAVSIALDMPDDADSGESNDLDELIDELDEGTSGDYAALVAEFNALVSQLDGIFGEFESFAAHAEQLMREYREASCNKSSVSYAISSGETQTVLYQTTLSQLTGLYGEILVADPSDQGAADFAAVDAQYTRLVGQGEAMDARYAALLATYGTFECDEDEADVDAGTTADEEADAEDVEAGTEGGGGTEVCGNQLDDDGDNLIDECDAGCCDKAVQVTVTDCGSAADDIFQIEIDGAFVGVTPKGAGNTFNVDLEPGSHSVTITCLDDGGVPLGQDIGTACVAVIVYNVDETSSIGGAGSAPTITYGGSVVVTFDVPAGPGTPIAIPMPTGAAHQAAGLK